VQRSSLYLRLPSYLTAFPLQVNQIDPNIVPAEHLQPTCCLPFDSIDLADPCEHSGKRPTGDLDTIAYRKGPTDLHILTKVGTARVTAGTCSSKSGFIAAIHSPSVIRHLRQPLSSTAGRQSRGWCR
jgi:hypothetical protein